MRKTFVIFYVFFLFDFLGRVLGGVGEIALLTLKQATGQNGVNLGDDIRARQLPRSEAAGA